MTSSFLPADANSAALGRYMSAAYSAPMLTVEQEAFYSQQFQLNQDTEAAKQLVLSHLRFVIHVAKKYQNFGVSLADLIQEGTVGLMKAIHRFDSDIGARLASFAVHWIKSAIHDYILKNWRLVKIATTKSQRKLFFNLHKFFVAGNSLSQDDIDFVAKSLSVTNKDIKEMESRLKAGSELSIDYTNDDEEEKSIGLELQASNKYEPELQVEQADFLNKRDAVLNAAISSLDPRSQDVIQQRYFVEHKMKLNDLAKRYNVSSERIRQVEKQALLKLKAFLANEKELPQQTLLLEDAAIEV